MTDDENPYYPDWQAATSPEPLLKGQPVFNWPLAGWHPGDDTTLREWLRERLS